MIARHHSRVAMIWSARAAIMVVALLTLVFWSASIALWVKYLGGNEFTQGVFFALSSLMLPEAAWLLTKLAIKRTRPCAEAAA